MMYGLLIAMLIFLLAIPSFLAKFPCSPSTCSQSWKDSISALYSYKIVRQLSRNTILPLVRATDCDFSSNTILSELTFPKTNFQCFEEKIELSTASAQHNIDGSAGGNDCFTKYLDLTLPFTVEP
jgi:hypothetical protein